MTERLTLTVEEAGELLGVGRQSAYQAARAGEIPTISIGRRLLVPKGKFLDMLGAGVASTGVPAADELKRWLDRDPERAAKTIKAGLALALSHGYDPDAPPSEFVLVDKSNETMDETMSESVVRAGEDR